FRRAYLPSPSSSSVSTRLPSARLQNSTWGARSSVSQSSTKLLSRLRWVMAMPLAAGEGGALFPGGRWCATVGIAQRHHAEAVPRRRFHHPPASAHEFDPARAECLEPGRFGLDVVG